MQRSIDTVVIGAGQAGLIMSRLLSDAGREHVVLERRATLGGGWQDRWDAFRLVSPNWTVTVPGYDYAGSDPDAFMPRDELIGHFREYASVINAPVEVDTAVTAVDPVDGPVARFSVTTTRGTILARTVVVATGPFQAPHVPAIADGLAPSILSLHVDGYRNPAALPDGGVLLVGSGQSGVQLAEELQAAGRTVTLSVGHCGHVPRRYRGRDVFWWYRQLATVGAGLGVMLPTADRLPSPSARFACNPQLSGHGGGHDISLRKMATEGARLVGRLAALEGTKARMQPDLGDNLRYADAFFDDRFRPLFDAFAERSGEDFPPAEIEHFEHEVPEVTALDLAAEGISTVLWTSGYRPVLDWIHMPVLDPYGLPIQTGGRSLVDGLCFIGTPWLIDMGSANLIGLVRDAKNLVSQI